MRKHFARQARGGFGEGSYHFLWQGVLGDFAEQVDHRIRITGLPGHERHVLLGPGSFDGSRRGRCNYYLPEQSFRCEYAQILRVLRAHTVGHGDEPLETSIICNRENSLGVPLHGMVEPFGCGIAVAAKVDSSECASM
nr:hypothetical protein [Streptomyces sp. NRRL WC-3618]